MKTIKIDFFCNKCKKKIYGTLKDTNEWVKLLNINTCPFCKQGFDGDFKKKEEEGKKKIKLNPYAWDGYLVDKMDKNL